MTPDEVKSFLATQDTMVIATLADGASTGTVARARLDGDQLVFVVADADPAVDQIARDDRVCCVIDQFPSYYEIKGVSWLLRMMNAIPRSCLPAPPSPSRSTTSPASTSPSSRVSRRLRGPRLWG